MDVWYWIRDEAKSLSRNEYTWAWLSCNAATISSYIKLSQDVWSARKDIIVFISIDMILWYDMILGISQKCYRVEMIHNMINNHTITFEHDIYTENEMIPSCYNAIQREKIYENNLQIHVLHNLAARLKCIYQNDQHTRLTIYLDWYNILIDVSNKLSVTNDRKWLCLWWWHDTWYCNKQKQCK